MKPDRLQDSLLPGGAHHQLGQLCGEWEGVTRTWFEPDQLADESPTRGTIRPTLGGRFVIHEYEGAQAGKPLQGLAIYGYNLTAEKWESAWIDSFHMGSGILFSEGPTNVRSLSVLGQYGDPSGGPPWGWRTEIAIADENQIVITAYNITPGGEEAKATETVYTRMR